MNVQRKIVVVALPTGSQGAGDLLNFFNQLDVDSLVVLATILRNIYDGRMNEFKRGEELKKVVSALYSLPNTTASFRRSYEVVTSISSSTFFRRNDARTADIEVLASVVERIVSQGEVHAAVEMDENDQESETEDEDNMRLAVDDDDDDDDDFDHYASWMDEELPVKSGQAYRVRMCSWKELHARYQSWCNDNVSVHRWFAISFILTCTSCSRFVQDFKAKHYQTWRKRMRLEKVHKATRMDWICPYCAAEHDDEDVFDAHVRLIESQRAFEQSIKKRIK